MSQYSSILVEHMIVCLIEREREREKKSTKYASINTQFIRRHDIEYEKKSVLFSMYKKKYEAYIRLLNKYLFFYSNKISMATKISREKNSFYQVERLEPGERSSSL